MARLTNAEIEAALGILEGEVDALTDYPDFTAGDLSVKGSMLLASKIKVHDLLDRLRPINDRTGYVNVGYPEDTDDGLGG